MKAPDNPLRLARIAAGLSQAELADIVGIDRSTLVAIEEGRTREPGEIVMKGLAAAVNADTDTLFRRLLDWRLNRIAVLTPSQRGYILQGSGAVRRCKTFSEWRGHIAPTPNAFASLLGVSTRLVAQYEKGARVREGLPPSLAGAIVKMLQVDEDYLLALEQLPVGD